MAGIPEPSFTRAVRQELARLPYGTDAEVRAELAAIVRHGGSLTVHGGTPVRVDVAVSTTSGAVARRTYGLVQHRYEARPELLVRAPAGVQRTTIYGVRIAAADRIVQDLGVVDVGGAPVDRLPEALADVAAAAYVRGALLAAGSISAPGRDPHLEIVTSSPALAAELAGLMRRLVDGRVTAMDGEDRARVVVKSGATIGEVLAAVGASSAFLAWDDQRLRRQLRGDANRLANADAANLRRSVEAAASQVAAVEAAIAHVGWDALDEDLRAVALARLANPGASLAELGELMDPPVGKSAVHRRLARLAGLTPGPSDPVDGGRRR